MSEQNKPKRTQAERTRVRKEQILREAIRQFGQFGYHGAKLSEIASAAGVTEPGLLHHFHGKAHLFMEVLAERDRLDSERFDSVAPGEATSPLGPMKKLVEYNQTVPGLVQLFTVLVAESIDETHPGHEFFRQRYQNLHAQGVELMRAAQARGDVRVDIPAEELAVMVYAMMDGLQVQWLYAPESVDMARVFESFARLLQGGLAHETYKE